MLHQEERASRRSSKGFVSGLFNTALVARACCLIALAVFNAGCAVLVSESTVVTPAASPAVVDTAVGGTPEKTPFVLDVLDEANDGQRLVIKGRVTSKSEWPANEIVLRLSALDEVGESRVVFNRLSELIPNLTVVAPNSPVNFTLAIASPGLASYQLEVLWGDEAARLASEPTPQHNAQTTPQTLVLRDLEVHRLPDSSCASPEECRVKFTITGEFFNSGAAVITEISLLAGFSDADKLDLTDQILENERKVEVRNMRLAPGASKAFRLALEILVPPSQQMAPRPVIRIVKVKTE